MPHNAMTTAEFWGILIAALGLILAMFTPIVNTLFKAHTAEILNQCLKTFQTKQDAKEVEERLDGRIDRLEERKT